MAAGDEAPVAASAPSNERNQDKPMASGEGSGNNRGKKGKKGDRGRGEWR